MADNVEDGFGPILQRIQERLGGIEAKLDRQDAKLDQLARDVKEQKTRSVLALGSASGAEFQADRAEQAAEKANKRLDALIEALKRQDIDVDA
jgi:uncharacterized coiled-coil protein SlyX